MRKLFFWLHLIAGSIAGVVILIMSVTGVLLMYERQIVEWVDRDFRVTPSGARLPVEALLVKARDTRGDFPAAITLRSDPSAPATLGFGRDGALYVNPYTGETLGEGSRGVREFFRAVTDWHRWLGKNGESRSTARAITGACNLAFLFLVCSGLYLWFPRKWAWQFVRPVLLFRGGLSGKARDFNWHNVIGFWCCIPLFFVVITGVVMSYPWANSLLYTLTRSEPPVQGPGGREANAARKKSPVRNPNSDQSAPLPRNAGSAQSPNPIRKADSDPSASPIRNTNADLNTSSIRNTKSDLNTNSIRDTNRAATVRERFREPDTDLDLTGLNQLWSQAEHQVPSWRSITLRLPNSARTPLTFAIDESDGGRPQTRSQLILSRTGEVVRWETFESYNLGRRLRSWGRFVHTGEAFGFAGQTVAGVASAGGVMLAITGLMLAWRRFRGWRSRMRNSKRAEVTAEIPVAG